MDCNDWQEVSLGEVCIKIGSGSTPRGGQNVYKSSGISLIRSQNILDFSFSKDGLVFIDDEQGNKLKNVTIEKNDILINITGDSVARVCKVLYDILPARVNQHVSIIRTIQEKAEKNFILYNLQFQKQLLLSLSSSGGTRNALTKDMLTQLKILLPPLETQQKIAKILSSLDDKIELNNKINQILEEQAQAIFKSWFVDFEPFGGVMPNDWEVKTISSLGDIVGGSTPSKSKEEYYTSNGLAWITPKDLSTNKSKFISKGSTDITELGYKKSSAKIMPKGTVLFSSRAPIGYTAIAKNDVTTNQGFKSIVPNDEIGTPYVYFYLKNSIDLIESMSSGSTFKEVSTAIMKTVPAIIPTYNTINKFENMCKPIFKYQEKLEFENENLTQLRDTLLPKLMSGEIDVDKIVV